MKKLPRVVLLGDSIRLGYQDQVRYELTDEALLWSPIENGQHSFNLLLNFNQWVVAKQPDVLHLNAGIWDTLRVARGSHIQVVPLEAYAQNVGNLVALAREYAFAQVIWATTTPINEAHYEKTLRRLGNSGGHTNADILRYNQAAIEAAQANGATINDLHALVMQNDPDQLICGDGVHFTTAGSELLGHQVAAKIRELL